MCLTFGLNPTAMAHILSAVEPENGASSTPRQRDPQAGDPQVQLDDSELWTRFQCLTNEMIVTKNGRYVGYSMVIPVVGLSALCLAFVLTHGCVLWDFRNFLENRQ